MDRYCYQKDLPADCSSGPNALQSTGDAQALQLGLTELFRPPEGKENPPGVNRQVLSAAMASLRPLTVVSGGPGMGKTWTVRNILALLYMQREIERQTKPDLLKGCLGRAQEKAVARMRESILKTSMDLPKVLGAAQ